MTKVITQIQSFNELSPNLLSEVVSLDEQIFDIPYPLEKIKRKSAEHNPLLLMAYDEGKPVGFKLGYALSSELFYSWMGGVLEGYRGRGIARELMTQQHQTLRELGYKRVRTKTRNEFKNMLLFNIKIGFEIVDTYQMPGETLRIVLEKDL